MQDWRSLFHVKWDCKYHIVIVPKYRQKRLYGKFRNQVGQILKELCRQKGIEILEGHLMPDHIHMCLQVPPKYSRSLKGEDFLNLLMQHVLPRGVRRVRDYGFLHGNAKKLLFLVQLILFVKIKKIEQRQRPAFKCRHCKSPMVVLGVRQSTGKPG